MTWVSLIYRTEPQLKSVKTEKLESNKKLSYRRGTARCVVSIEILPIATQHAETTYTTSPDQIDGMKLEI